MSGQKRKFRQEDSNEVHHGKRQKTSKTLHRADHSSSEFRIITASMNVIIPAVFAQTPRRGVSEMLDSMLMRYIPNLQGVVLSHSNLKIQSSTATLLPASAFSRCDVTFDVVLWSPTIGMQLVGKINLCSPDHVSLLVHKTFNVSIPRHHIPTQHYQFEYGPAENDPEFGPAATAAGTQQNQLLDDEQAPDSGHWLHTSTGEPLGGSDRSLAFTVIGLTIANQMLSVIGSIQSDPFSSSHVAQPVALPSTTSKQRRQPSKAHVTSDEEQEDVSTMLMEGLGETDGGNMALEGDGDEVEIPDAEAEAARLAAKAERKRKRREEKRARKAKDGPDVELGAGLDDPPKRKRRKKEKDKAIST